MDSEERCSTCSLRRTTGTSVAAYFRPIFEKDSLAQLTEISLPRTPRKTVRRAKAKGSGRALWAIVNWFTLDNISKIASIGTPILLAVGGWYLTDVWKA